MDSHKNIDERQTFLFLGNDFFIIKFDHSFYRLDNKTTKKTELQNEN